MTFGHFLLTAWRFQPSVALGLLMLLVAYLCGVSASARQRVSFTAGMAVAALALLSPLDVLADDYLFSAHMVQHMLLILVVAPLALLGIPGPFARRVLRWPPMGRAERVVGWPPLAWWLGTLTLWTWHLPVLYQGALQHDGLHAIQHLSFLVTSAVFWWPVIAPHRWEGDPLLVPWAGALYLAAAMVASSVLGIIFTLSGTVIYPVYQRLPDTYGLRALLSEQGHLRPLADQQLGGAVMWILGGLPYLVGMVAILIRWFASPEDDPGGAVAVVSAQG